MFMAQSRQTHSKHHGYSVSLDHFLLTANNYQTHPAQMPCIVCVCVCVHVCVCVCAGDKGLCVQGDRDAGQADGGAHQVC